MRSAELRIFGASMSCMISVLATAAAAQVPATLSGQSIEAQAESATDIIVTAQRRSQRLQDVPIAITAFGSGDLESRGVTDLGSLRGSIPSLNITGFVGINTSNLVAIRGISGQPLGIGANQATAIYLDGAYLARPDSAFFELDDIERIEVLRGPQGTLYGRNATAGAINIITRAPGPDLRASGSVSFGNYDELRAKGSINGPIGSGLYAGLSGSFEKRDGYYVNVLTGNQVGKKTSFTVRGKLRYVTDDDGFEIVVSPDYTRMRAHEFGKTLLDTSSNVLGGTYIGFGNPKEIASNIEDRTFYNVNSWGVAGTITYRPSDTITLTSISGYRDLHTYTGYDGDGSSAPLFRSFSENNNETFNQELRLSYEGEHVKLTAGANYLNEKANYYLSANPPGQPIATRAPYATTDLDALGVFGQLEYDITAQLTAVAGIRFNRESRDFTVDYSRAIPTPGFVQSGKIEDSKFIPAVGLNYQATPDILIYGKISKGYQSPGFNPAPGSRAPLNTFGAETLTAYEVGAKTQFLDRMLTINGALFYYDYKDIQVRSVRSFGIIVISNAASATVKGGEVEVTLRPGGGLTLSGHATYSRAVYGKGFCELISPANVQASDPLCTPGFVDRTGNSLVNAPRWTGGANINWQGRLSNTLGLKVNASYIFESRVYYTTANEIAAGNGGWQRLDARVSLEFGKNFEVFAYGKNIADKRYVAEAIRVNNNVSYSFLNDPRTYGIGTKFNF